MTYVLSPHEAMVRGFMLEGETEDDSHHLARTALRALIVAGYVVKVRGGEVVELSDRN